MAKERVKQMQLEKAELMRLKKEAKEKKDKYLEANIESSNKIVKLHKKWKMLKLRKKK